MRKRHIKQIQKAENTRTYLNPTMSVILLNINRVQLHEIPVRRDFLNPSYVMLTTEKIHRKYAERLQKQV